MKKYVYIKYSLDWLLAAVLLVLTGWLQLLLALVIKLDDPSSPVMYNATRIGKDLKPFKMYKFRTMKPLYEGAGRVEAASLTAPGRFLRRTSLDELPQLFNILRGEMSFIGPRPLILRYVPWYTKRQNSRHDVRPGLTGLAQVNGRVNCAWDKRFAYDADYVDNMSLALDINILFATVFKTLRGDDALVTDDGESFDYFDDFQRDQLRRGLVRASDLAHEQTSEAAVAAFK
ncbi:sugar transferase [Oscillospiraceae bacterium CM]|nr:sugar transferase [Oscillospiraceae bacterium CM]